MSALRCVVEVGTHTEPFWRDTDSGMVACDRHRWQYDERDDLGPFNWVKFAAPSTGREPKP